MTTALASASTASARALAFLRVFIVSRTAAAVLRSHLRWALIPRACASFVAPPQVHPANLADMLSAFDPNEDWAFSQSSPHAKHGFRAFGGAGIITSRALTVKVVV